jgi:predicted unusual protein kinase regulating ubiquinone biosynthesis (AarF/ABC1/UbiB family)
MDTADINRRAVAKRLFDTYLKQIFEDRFFHADQHPGNLFVLPHEQDEVTGQRRWQIVFVDFGMTGTISASMLDALRELFIAVGLRDPARLIRAYEMMGILLPGADVELLEKANAQAFERFWGKRTTEYVGMGQKEIMDFVREFEELLYELPFQIPENLILLGRSLSILSGICTGLDADFNIWTSVAPYAEKLVASEEGGNWRMIWREVTNNLMTLLSLPRKTESLPALMEQGRLEVRMPQLNEQIYNLYRSLRKLVWAILFSALLFAGLVLFLNGYRIPSIVSWVLGLVFLLLAIF